MSQITIPVSGMHCGACVVAVDKAIRGIPGVSDVSVSYADGSARIDWKEGFGISASSLRSVSRQLTAAGYELPITKVRLGITGMTCAGCAATVTKKLLSLPFVSDADVNFASSVATVSGVFEGDPSNALIRAIKQSGYQAQTIDHKSGSRGNNKGSSIDIPVFSVLAIAILFMADMVLGMSSGHVLTPLVQAVLATGVQVLALIRFGRPALSGVLHGVGNMDLLVLVGTSAAYGMSLFNMMVAPQPVPGSETLTEGAPTLALYFEASVVVTAFVLFGRWLEGRARQATRSAIDALRDLRPKVALVRRDGRDMEIDVSALDVGDLLVVRAGDAFAADGIVETGHSAVDAALVTGESVPEEVGPGDTVYGGSTNGNGALTVRVSAIGGETLLGRVIDRVSLAQSTAPPVQRLADQVVQVFVPIVLCISGLTLGFWLFQGADTTTAVINAVSVLVIACPCALGLATPITIMVGVGVAAQRGILFKDAIAVETGARVTSVVLDKTGTVTEGNPRLTSELVNAEEISKDELLRLTASLQAGSSHPLAGAIRKEAHMRDINLIPADATETLPGRGVRGRVDGHRLAAGNLPFMKDLGITEVDGQISAEQPGTIVYVADTGSRRLLGTMIFEDPLRTGAAPAIQNLKALGIETSMLSGDRLAAVSAAADALGLRDFHADVTPNDKADVISSLIENGKVVAMVGDGINDAPAMAQADLGIAVRGGTDVAMESADVVLLHEDPGLIPATLGIARAVTAKLKQNLFWAFAYNVIAIPLAAAGFLSPVIAGAAMALSSLSVVANALLLRRHQAKTGVGG